MDDKILIETWDLALKEYNYFYSIDPSIRKQAECMTGTSREGMTGTLREVSLSGVNTSSISKKRYPSD